MCGSNYTENFSDSFHCLNLKKNILSFFSEQILGDVELKTSDRTIVAHKVILATSSVYFRTLFTTDVGSSSDKAIVKLSEFDGQTVFDVVKFIYTGAIQLSWSNIFEMMQLDDFLQVWSLRQLISTFLLRAIDKTTYLQVAVHAEFYRYWDVVDQAESFIADNFKTLIKETEFLKVPLGFLMRFLNSSVLNVPTEGILLCNLVSWVMHDHEDRVNHFEEILSKVDPRKVLSWAHSVKVVRKLTSGTKAEEIMERWIEKSLELRDQYQRSFDITNSLKPSYRELTIDGVFAIGGMDSDFEPIGSVEVCLDVATSPWKLLLPTLASNSNLTTTGGLELSRMPTPRHSQMTARRDRFSFYCIGGVIGDDEEICDVDLYSSLTNSWAKCSSLPWAIYNGAAVHMDHALYVTGGVYFGSTLSCTLMLRDGKSKWMELSPLKVARRNHCLVKCCGTIYAIGGKDGDGVPISFVERYDVPTDTWLLVESMLVPRHTFCAASPRDSPFIYVCRGVPREQDQTLPIIERYDTSQNVWTPIRSGGPCTWNPVFGAGVGQSSSLTMICQDAHYSPSCAIKVFSTISKTWLDAGPALLVSRSRGSLVSVEIPVYKKARI